MNFLIFTALIEKLIMIGLDGLAKAPNSNITNIISKAISDSVKNKSAADQLSEMIKTKNEVKNG